MWQTRAMQAEEQLKQLAATVSERPEHQDATGEHAEDVASPESSDTPLRRVRSLLRRLLGE